MKERFRHIAGMLVIAGLLIGFAGCATEDDDDDDAVVDGLQGELTEDLDAGGSPYLVTGDITIPAGSTINVDPGVEVYFAGNYAFRVEGTLNAIGSEENRIRFAAQNPPSIDERGAWRGIWLLGSDDSQLEYVQVSHAGRYNLIEDTTRSYIVNNDGSRRGIIDTTLHRGAITIRNCAPVVRRCVIDLGGYDGIQVVGASATGERPLIEFNTIVLNSFNGIRVEPDWELYQESGTGVGGALIRHNIITENDDAGIRLPESPGLYALGLVPELGYNNIYSNASLDYVPPSFELFPPVGIDQDIHAPAFFEDIALGDYRLDPCSGVIDRGDPAAGEDPDGTRRDLGAYWLAQGAYHLSNRLEGSKLTLDNDEYIVRCNAFVEQGDVLTISPGTRILFEGRFNLAVRGEIQAVGTAANPIVFTSMSENPRRGDWRQLLLDHASSNSTLEHVIIEYASVSNLQKPQPDTLGALSLINSSPTLRNVTIREAYYAGLYFFDDSSPDVVDNITVEGAGMHGIVCELNSTPTITRTAIRNVLGYGVHFVQNSSASLSNVLIEGPQVAGLVMEGLSSPSVNHVTVYGIYQGANGLPQNISHGVRAREYCRPTISNSILSYYAAAAVEAQVSSLPSLNSVLLYTDVLGIGDETVGTVDETNSLEGDPLFVDPAAGNFRLQAASPGAGAATDGTDLGAYGGSNPL